MINIVVRLIVFIRSIALDVLSRMVKSNLCLFQLQSMQVDIDKPTDPSRPCPPCVEFGKYELNTWYSSPYPLEYTRYVIVSLPFYPFPVWNSSCFVSVNSCDTAVFSKC